MAEPEPKEEYLQKKKEVVQLRTQLMSLHAEKEKAYQELHSFGPQIRSIMGNITTLKQERDQLTSQVKALKEEREKLNGVVKEKAHEKQEVLDKKKDLLQGAERKESPGRLKAEIARLEMKIQTEVMPFTKEQQLTKHIKELRAKVKQAEQLKEAWKEVTTASTDFSESRKKANEIHRQIQQVAEQSQGKHEQMNKLYEQLKQLRQQEKPAKQRYLELKSQWEQVKKNFDGFIARVNELAKLFQEDDEKSFQAKARERSTEVQKKLLQGKKLRMEDILAFQAGKE